MKKLILICSFIAMVLSANAQVRFGVKGGLNINTIRVDNGLAPDPKLGFHAGVMLDMKLSENMYFNPQLLYTQRGCSYDDMNIGGISGDIKMTLNYIQLPIDFNYRTPITESISFDGIFGPYMAYGLSTKTKTKANGISYTTSENLFGEDGLKRFDFGLRFGVGTHVGNHASVALIYDLGLVNMADSSETDEKDRNGSFQISFGWTF